MKRLILICLIVSFLPAHIIAGTVELCNGNLRITNKIAGGEYVSYLFKKCMANELYTFYEVATSTDSLSWSVVNRASSDNIGPFLISKHGWCGGNHIYLDTSIKTATTLDVQISADGVKLVSDTLLGCEKVNIKVRNSIFNPASYGNGMYADTLCYEIVNYIVRGNSIDVNVKHDYVNSLPVTIERYYGMQSMFCNENAMLTPCGKYNSWTPITAVDRYIKRDFPESNCFVERADNCYQSTYLTAEGLGARKELPDSDYIFIGNSWTKSYHKLIGDSKRSNGDSDMWHGVYSWFVNPQIDSSSIFAYNGYYCGKKAIFVNCLKPCKAKLPCNMLPKGKIHIVDASRKIKMAIKRKSINFECGIPSSAILVFDN